MGRVTLQTIADRVGVSRMTVSNAFSRPDQLSAELRKRVLAVAKELGYAGPDPAGRALARGTTGAVGVLLTDSLGYAFTDEVATGFLGAVTDELAPTGLALTLLTSEQRGEAVPARDVAIDGALVYSCRQRSPGRDWLLRRQLPVVFVDQDPVPDIPSINVDDRGGARAAADHLVGLGHRRVAIVTLAADAIGFADGEPADGTAPHPQRQRMLGWLDGLSDAGIEPQLVELHAHTDLAASEAAESALVGDDRPTGVLCFSDVLALGVAQAANRVGLSIPGELSIVGFDDSPAARRNDPPLTTVHQDVSEKGRLATLALTTAISHAAAGTTYAPEHHVLPTELVVRESTAAPPRA